MAETEGCGGEFIENGGVTGGLVRGGVSVGEEVETELVDDIPAKNAGEELGVSDVLRGRGEDTPGMLVNGLVAPLRIPYSQSGRDAVVLAKPDRMDHSENGLFRGAEVTWE